MLITTLIKIGEKIDWLRKIMESTNLRVEKLDKTQKIIRDAEKVEELRKHENIIRDEIRTKLALA